MTVETHTLANGLRIVTEHMPGLQSAALGVWVSVGGRHERADQNGIAHFLEHMAFKGTARRSAQAIAEEIEDVGGFINAYTSREATAYYARVLKNDVPLALDLISDIVLNPAFDPREIEVERGVILQEIGQANDTPDDIIFDWLQEAAYPEQPLGRTILGPVKRVQGFNRPDFERFIGAHYGPGQLILSAAGAVDHDQIVKLAETHFSHLKPQPVLAAEPASFLGGERREVKSLEQAHFTLALEAPGYRSDDVYAAQIFSTALGGGMSSRLFQEIRERRGLCYTIFAQVGSYDDTGMMTIYAGTGADDLPELAQLTIDELRRTTDGLSRAELDRARAQMKAGMLMGLESPSARAERLARLVAIWDRVPTLEETIARVDAVTLEGLRDLACGIAGAGKSAMALYGPVDQAPSLAHMTERFGGVMIARKAKPRIETERLSLRLPQHGDFRAWASLRNASTRFLQPWEPTWASDHLSRKSFTNRVYWASRAVGQGSAMPLFMLLREGGGLVGAITLDNIRRGPSQAGTLGYWIGESHARQGYMREAIEGVVHYAFATLDLSRVEAACLPENVASRGVLEKAGFKYEGVAQSYLQINGRWRNHVLYSNLRADRRGRTDAR